MNPIENPDAYYTCKLNGIKVPGKCVPAGASDKRKWDVAPGQGTDGASIKGGGASELSSFTINAQLYTPQQFDAFERDIRPLFKKPKEGEKPKAVDIEYPELLKLDITRVVLEEIGQLETVDDSGLYQYPMKVLQYRPAKPASVLKAKGDDTPGGPGDKDKIARIKDPLDLQIEALTKRLNEEASK